MLRQALKENTHAAHMRLHEHPFTQPLQSDEMSQSEYLRILSGFHQYYSVWEGAFLSVDNRFKDEMQPLDLLKEDFELFHLPVPDDMADFKLSRLNELDLRSAYLGYLYVKQGSTLGGQIMSKHISRVFNIDKECDIHFFNPYGSQTGVVWKEFLSYLEQAQDRICMENALEAAYLAFSTLEAHFNRLGQMEKER